MNFKPETYPRKIEGDFTKDNILEMNPELKLFPAVQKLQKSFGKKKGAEDMVNRVLWAHVHLLDPRSFYEGKMSGDDIKELLEKEYLGSWWKGDESWEKYKYVEEFVLRKILVSTDVIYYVMAKRSFERDIINLNIKPDKIKQQKDVIEELKEAAFSVIKEAKQYYEISGDRQPGLLARTPVH